MANSPVATHPLIRRAPHTSPAGAALAASRGTRSTLRDDLARAVAPVVERLRDDLEGTDICVVATVADAQILTTGTPDDVVHRVLDALAGGAAATAPITDPRTGQCLGSMSLVSATDTENPLLLPVARLGARDVELRLLDGCSARKRLLDERFLRARRSSRAPLVAIADHTILVNAAASRLFGGVDRSRLWVEAERAIRLERGEIAIAAGDGSEVVATIEPLRDGPDLIGALLRTQLRSPRSRPTLGWASLTESERSLAELVAGGLTNKQAAAQLFMSRHTVDAHLRQIFRKLDINSRVELARLVTIRNADDRAVA